MPACPKIYSIDLRSGQLPWAGLARPKAQIFELGRLIFATFCALAHIGAVLGRQG